MLVLSRKMGESIEFPSLGVVIRVVGLKKSRIQLGIEAPREIEISRGENPSESSPRRTGSHPTESRSREPFAQVEARIAALAELCDPQYRAIAEQLAAETIGRLSDCKRTSVGQPDQPSMMADLIAVRTEVLDELRRNHAAVESPTCVRQSSSGYAISRHGAPQPHSPLPGSPLPGSPLPRCSVGA